MREELAIKVNEAFDHLMARIEHEIKQAPVEQLEHVAHVLLQIMDFKNAMQQAEGNQMAQEAIMRTVKRKIDKGEFNVGLGEMPGFPGSPGFPPTAPEPPQQPQQ